MKRVSKNRSGWLAQVLFILSLVFLGFGLFSLGWLAWPSPTESVQFAIPAGVLAGAPAGETFASLADYNLTVSWPTWVRAGEEGVIRVTLTESADLEPLPAVNREAQVVLVEPALAGLPIRPPGRMQANLAEKQDLNLTWVIEGVVTGEFLGKVFVAFGFYDQTLNELVPVPVAVVDVSIRVTSLWGVDSGLVVWFGLVGLALWGGLFLMGRVIQVR